MEFREFPVGQAVGAILAHSLRLDERTVKKGTVLTAADIADLDAGGYATVVAVKPGPDDIAEDDAAAALAGALAGGGIVIDRPAAGRCNLLAGADGLLRVDVAALDAVNLVHESMTVATLGDHAVVARDQLVATVKAIPYAVAAAYLRAAVRAASGRQVLAVRPFRPLVAGLIQTRLRGSQPELLDKTRRVLTQRLERLGGRLGDERCCEHREADIAEAIAASSDRNPDLLVISGASAVADRRDVVPSAVVRAGGELVHFGMPVDPGNLLLLARIGTIPVLAMPGCARSPKYNGFDMILERLAAGIAVTPQDIMRMGVGGLLSEIPERPSPRRKAAGVDHRKVSAIVLAAGRSSRMGDTNKLLVEIDGWAMVRRVADMLAEAGVGEIIVVTGYQAERVEETLRGCALRCVRNPEHDTGMSTSLRAGLKAVAADATAVLVCLGDMPLVGAGDVVRLIAEFDPAAGREICVPVFQGKRGNPVLWARRFIGEMLLLEGDVGAKHLLFKNDDVVHEVVIPTDGILTDIDTPQALHELTRF